MLGNGGPWIPDSVFDLLREITKLKFFEFRMHELSEKLLNFITKDGKCSNLEKLLSNVEDPKELGNDSPPKYHGRRPFFHQRSVSGRDVW